jgi:serine beta-lactamase-like protein LACTB, mitochondrial
MTLRARLLRTPLLAAALALAPALTAAQQPALVAAAPTEYAAAVAEARRLVSDTMRVLGVPGAQITVWRAGRIIWSEGIGWADLEQQVPMTTLTRSRIGSISKSLAAVALGLLVEDAGLDLDAPVQQYVPAFPLKRWPITTRQVAGHLAGIRHYGDPGEFASREAYADVTAGLAIFAGDSLRFEPGTQYGYSTYGYTLVSAVIEGASEEPFLAFMRERVLEPLGMWQTVAEHVDSIIPFRASYYTRDSLGGVVNAPWVDNSYKWAGGGYVSTTEDLVRFAEGLLEGRILEPGTRELLWTSQRTSDGRETGYGIGWRVGADSAGRRTVAHSGGSMGATANLIVYPDERLIIALLVNSDNTFVGAAPRIAELFLR